MAGVTSGDVARESGVSRTTVSYVLSGREGVTISEATRRRVREAAERLGYHPSAAARTLRTGRSDLVVCVMPDWPAGPVVDATLDHLTQDLAERGLSLLVHHGGDPRPLSDLWRAVTPRAVVGLGPLSPGELRGLEQAGIQVVGTPQVDPGESRPFAAAQRNLGRLQADFLLDRGHTRLGWAAPADTRLSDFAEPRFEGVRAACHDRRAPDPVGTIVELDVDSAATAARRWRAAGVTAVAAYNDEVALSVLAGLREEALAVPGDVAVMGVDDHPLARLAVPALTTVSQPVTAEARYLADTVVAALDGTSPPDHPGAPSVVVVRDSA